MQRKNNQLLSKENVTGVTLFYNTKKLIFIYLIKSLKLVGEMGDES